MRILTYLTFILLILTSCSETFEKIPENDFIGTWELNGRKMLNGIQVTIAEENGKLVGRLSRLNENKYVQFFADSNDIWVPEINRISNYQFRLTEKKIGNELFSLYGLQSSQEFKVEFLDKNTFGLSAGNSDPDKSEIKYRRIK